MDLYLSLQNKELQDIHEDFTGEVWLAFHQGEINDQDDFYNYLHEYIDNAVIYNSDCESILNGNSEYHYEDHDLYGRPNNISQAAFACLYDYITDHIDTPNWTGMEIVLNEANE
tara:strand:- start:70 stop:411 length:342 start_codon:yes stop_codon:yes gene_type:complete